jgi:IS30 family transposase
MVVQRNTKHFTHLTQEERIEIYHHLKNGKNKHEIARILGRHHASIGREIERNSVDYGR